MSPRPTWFFNFLLVLGSTLVVLLCADGVLRALQWSPERHRVRVRLSSRGDLQLRNGSVVLDCYPSQSRDGFPIDLRRRETQEHYRALGIVDLTPALPESPWCVEFRYNALGARGPEYGPRRPGVQRIVVMGDSFTEGQGVREDEVYPSILAARLAGAVPGRYEVLNVGQRATDFPELNAQFDRALDLSPDLLIYGLCLNDAERSTEYDRRWPRLNDWIMVRRPEVPLEWWQSRLWAFVTDRVEQWQVSRDSSDWYLGMYGPANREGWERTREDFRRMRREAESHGARLLVVVWPLLVGLEGDYPFSEVHERLRRVFERQGIPHQDLLEVLRGKPSASLWAHPADRHPNGKAHALAAESLVPRVRALLEAPTTAGPS